MFVALRRSGIEIYVVHRQGGAGLVFMPIQPRRWTANLGGIRSCNRLEDQLQADLHIAGQIGLAGDLTEIRPGRIDEVVRVKAEDRVIERVQELAPNLEP